MTSLDRVLAPHRWSPGSARCGSPVRLGPGGIPLGRFADGTPALLQVMRPTAVTVTAIVTRATAAVLAMRAWAAGARIVVRDDDVTWQVVAKSAGDVRPVLLLDAAQDLPAEAGTFERPVVVFDSSDAAVTGPPARPGWWVTVAMRPHVSFQTLTAARDTDLILLGRLAEHEAALLGSTCRLPAPAADSFQHLGKWQVGVVSAGRPTIVDLALTESELQLCASVAGWRAVPGRRRRAADPGSGTPDDGRGRAR